MDTSTLPYDVLCFRIRSARQKKRAQKQDFDKQLIRLHTREQQLRDAKWALPMVPLKEPYQKGWKRTFVLREDAAASKHAAFYTALLLKINTIMYWQNKAFTKIRRHKRKKLPVPIPQAVKMFSEYEWCHPKTQLTAAERNCFHVEKHWYKNTQFYDIHYVFNEPWRYVLKVEPNIITEVKMLDTLLEQQIAELDMHVSSNNLWHRIHRLTNGRRYSWKRSRGEKPKEIDPNKNKPFQAIVQEWEHHKTTNK